MSARPEFLSFDVGNGDARTTIGALSWEGNLGAPTIITAHGITANAWAWDPVAHHLEGAAHVVALDLRGRGRSYQAAGPFGLRRHADDVADVIAQLDGPLLVAGHSMGAAVALMATKRHRALVHRVVLVDGGPPLSRPAVPGTDVDALLESLLGPAIERLRTVWPDRVTYHAMWAQHPAYVDGIGPDLERNLLADLVEVDGGFRTAVSEPAVLEDARDLLADNEIRSLLADAEQPATLVRAEFGMFGAPPPVIPDDISESFPQHRWIDGPGLNHYTVLGSPAGARLVADTIRHALTH